MARLAREWPGLRYHQWIEYADAHGTGRCEPEAYVVLADRVVLFECKLTGSEQGRAQLLDLYVPLLSAIYALPVVAVQVCKSVSPTTPGPFIDTFADVAGLTPGAYATLQLPR